MFIFLLGCVVALYYYDKYYVRKRKWSVVEKETVKQTNDEENKKAVVENDNALIVKKVSDNDKFKTFKEEMENLGFVERNDLEKLKKQWRDLIYFKIPLFVIVSLFIFPGALLFLPIYFAIKYLIIKTRINYLERRSND